MRALLVSVLFPLCPAFKSAFSLKLALPGNRVRSMTYLAAVLSNGLHISLNIDLLVLVEHVFRRLYLVLVLVDWLACTCLERLFNELLVFRKNCLLIRVGSSGSRSSHSLALALLCRH